MFNKKLKRKWLAGFCLIAAFAFAAFAQNSNHKKNQRQTPAVSENGKNAEIAADKPIYFYEFSRPDFNLSNVSIEHDEKGKGKITFLKKYVDEDITDPIQISPTALERIKEIWQALNFLEAGEDYQYENDYSHLGNMKFSVIKDGRTRTTKFNWTTNQDAKALAGEYQKIANQFVWLFDINLAKENQPLEAPKVMNKLDLHLKRGEISDPVQLIPYLKELSDDERIPLISRNKASKLAAEIEKKAEKDEKKLEKTQAEKQR